MSDHRPPRSASSGPGSPLGNGGFGHTPPPALGAHVPPPLPGAYGPVPPSGMVPAPRSLNGFAVVSLVAGVVSLFACYLGIVTGIVGVVLGIIGLRQSHTDPERFSGTSGGVAIAGIIVSVVAALGWVVLILFLNAMENIGM